MYRLTLSWLHMLFDIVFMCMIVCSLLFFCSPICWHIIYLFIYFRCRWQSMFALVRHTYNYSVTLLAQNANKVGNQFSTPYKISYVHEMVFSFVHFLTIVSLLLSAIFPLLPRLLLDFDGAILIWIHFCDRIKARIIFAPCQRCAMHTHTHKRFANMRWIQN